MNPEELIRSRTQKYILDIAKKQGYVHRNLVYQLYSTVERAKGALKQLHQFGLLKPDESGNLWVYAKASSDNTEQQELNIEVKECQS